MNDGEAIIEAKFGSVTVVNRTMELCSIDEELFNCPIQKGKTSTIPSLPKIKGKTVTFNGYY